MAKDAKMVLKVLGDVAQSIIKAPGMVVGGVVGLGAMGVSAASKGVAAGTRAFASGIGGGFRAVTGMGKAGQKVATELAEESFDAMDDVVRYLNGSDIAEDIAESIAKTGVGEKSGLGGFIGEHPFIATGIAAGGGYAASRIFDDDE